MPKSEAVMITITPDVPKPSRVEIFAIASGMRLVDLSILAEPHLVRGEE